MVESLYEGGNELTTDSKDQTDDKEKGTENSERIRVRSSYRDLGDVLWPKYGGLLLDSLQSIDLLTLAISYIISCGSLLAHALPGAGLSQAMWAAIFALVVLPTTFVTDLSCVVWQSLLGMTSLFTMAGVMVSYAVTHVSHINIKDILVWDTEGALVAFGLVISSYCVYSVLIPVEESMADRPKFDLALGISLSMAAIFKALFALCGFLSFTQHTDEVIGNNFPLGFARIAVSIVYVSYIVLSYTLTVKPLFQSFDETRLATLVISYVPAVVWTVATRCLTAGLTLVIAVMVPHLALLTAFVGSLVLCFLEYIVPCAVHLKLRFSDMKLVHVVADVSVIVTGVLGTIFGTYFSGKALVIAMAKG